MASAAPVRSCRRRPISSAASSASPQERCRRFRGVAASSIATEGTLSAWRVSSLDRKGFKLTVRRVRSIHRRREEFQVANNWNCLYASAKPCDTWILDAQDAPDRDRVFVYPNPPFFAPAANRPAPMAARQRIVATLASIFFFPRPGQTLRPDAEHFDFHARLRCLFMIMWSRGT